MKTGECPGKPDLIDRHFHFDPVLHTQHFAKPTKLFLVGLLFQVGDRQVQFAFDTNRSM